MTAHIQIIISMQPINQSESSLQHSEDILMENMPFSYKKYPSIIFVPVYPRAHVEEVVGIDFDRRTVTARFVLHITVCLKIEDGKLREFIKKHMILQFDYNQVIYIPELMKLDNPPFIIQEVIEPDQKENYISYKIKGNLECQALFDLMLFPYLQIDVINHLVIRSQQFEDTTIKYNSMLIRNTNNTPVSQFSPYFINPQFAGYRIRCSSTQIYTDESLYHMKNKLIKNWSLIGYITDFMGLCRDDHDDEDDIPQEWVARIAKVLVDGQIDEPSVPEDDMEEFCPFKHIALKFTMTSLKLAFFLENQVPIWVLGVVSIYLFDSQPDLGNRYGNAILILVSMIALLINFRENQVAVHSITFYQLKMMMVMVVPLLVIISTTVDSYSNIDPNLTSFALRSSQLENPFMLASIIIYGSCAAATGLFFIYILLFREINWDPDQKKAVRGHQLSELWENLEECEWGHSKLYKKMTDIMQQSCDSFRYQKVNKKVLGQGMKKRLLTNLKKRQTLSMNKSIPVKKRPMQIEMNPISATN